MNHLRADNRTVVVVPTKQRRPTQLCLRSSISRNDNRMILILLSLLIIVSVDIVTLSPYVCSAFTLTIRNQSYHQQQQPQQLQQQRYDHAGILQYKTHQWYQSFFRIYSYTTTGSNYHNLDDPDHQNTTSSSASLDNNSNDNDISSNNNNSNITVLRNSNNNKKKSSSTTNTWKEYKIVDNRDALPFQIQVHTPPDYHTTIMALPSTSSSTTTTTKKDDSKKKKSSDTTATTTMLSSVYRSNEENDNNNNNNSNKKKTNKTKKDNKDDDTDAVLLQKLGDYVLDATTTTGDTILIQDMVYRVVRHRCLYQYTQKRFVLCRKILEVKELNRYLSEQYITQQFNL